MARGFGATHGVAGTDAIISPSAVSPITNITILVRYRQFSAGSGNTFGRMVHIVTSTSGSIVDLVNLGNTGNLGFSASPSSTNPYWRWPRPAFGTPSSLGVSVALTENTRPFVMQNNIEYIPTQVSPATWATVDGVPIIGNNTSNGRSWDGHLQDVAIYNTELTEEEHRRFQAGESPATIRPGSLVHYLPLDSDPRIDLAGEHKIWTPTGTRYADGQIFPHVEPRRQPVFLPAWGSGGAADIVINSTISTSTVTSISSSVEQAVDHNVNSAVSVSSVQSVNSGVELSLDTVINTDTSVSSISSLDASIEQAIDVNINTSISVSSVESLNSGIEQQADVTINSAPSVSSVASLDADITLSTGITINSAVSLAGIESLQTNVVLLADVNIDTPVSVSAIESLPASIESLADIGIDSGVSVSEITSLGSSVEVTAEITINPAVSVTSIQSIASAIDFDFLLDSEISAVGVYSFDDDVSLIIPGDIIRAGQPIRLSMYKNKITLGSRS